MTDPTLDQIAAAQADARNMMKTTLGSDGPTSGTSPIIERYLVRLPLDNRCAHLRAVPLQPMFLLMPTDLWRCRDCVAAYAANPLQLTDVEENTCDNCRRHFPGQGASFTPFVFRQDLLMLQGSACDECTASFETKGVTVKDL
ncbi:hypothetical protein [Streptomyces sp. SAS_260]|uniref:hypothetical protein n=1 Tax=Streptomyces sp. SAS_260 TaxID=3412751 RepID=UPI00403CEBD9